MAAAAIAGEGRDTAWGALERVLSEQLVADGPWVMVFEPHCDQIDTVVELGPAQAVSLLARGVRREEGAQGFVAYSRGGRSMSDHSAAAGLEHYLQDLITLVKEKALDAKAQRDVAAGEDRVYAMGRLMAFHELISLMRQQANAFGIGLDQLRLEDIQPERDLA